MKIMPWLPNQFPPRETALRHPRRGKPGTHETGDGRDVFSRFSVSEKTLPEAGRAFFRVPRRAVGSQWDHLGSKIVRGGGKRVYTRTRREAKKLIPVNYYQPYAASLGQKRFVSIALSC